MTVVFRFYFIYLIEVQLTYNVVLDSGIQQSDSAYIYMCVCVCIYIYIYIYILFQILFPYRLLQNIELSSLCSILYMVVWIC